MSDTVLRLGEEKLQELASAAVVAAMGPEEREALIASAIKQLFQKKEGRGYGHLATSPLHEAFTRAMTRHAETIAEESITSDEELTEKIRGVVREAIEKVLVKDREETVKVVAMAIRSAMFDLKDNSR